MEPFRGGVKWPGAGYSLAVDHADTKSNMQDLQPLVMDMGTGQQASGSGLDKVLSPGHHACLSYSQRGEAHCIHAKPWRICSNRPSAALLSLNRFYQAT